MNDDRTEVKGLTKHVLQDLQKHCGMEGEDEEWLSDLESVVEEMRVESHKTEVVAVLQEIGVLIEKALELEKKVRVLKRTKRTRDASIKSSALKEVQTI